jgi:hypothetical protein
MTDTSTSGSSGASSVATNQMTRTGTTAATLIKRTGTTVRVENKAALPKQPYDPTILIRRYFSPYIMGDDAMRNRNLEKIGGVFVKTPGQLPYIPGRHGIPLYKWAASPFARIAIPLFIVGVPNAVLLSLYPTVDSFFAAQSFSGFGLILWICAGVGTGIIGHGIAAAAATACLLNGIDKSMKIQNKPSPVSTDVLVYTPLTIGIVTTIIMATLTKYGNLPSLLTSSAKLREIVWF